MIPIDEADAAHEVWRLTYRVATMQQWAKSGPEPFMGEVLNLEILRDSIGVLIELIKRGNDEREIGSGAAGRISREAVV